MEEQESNDERIVTQSYKNNEEGLEDPRDNSLRDLRQILRSLNSRKKIDSKNITEIKIPKEKKAEKLYLEDTPSLEFFYSKENLDRNIGTIKNDNLRYYKQLNRSSMKSISSRTMNRYIDNLARHNLNIGKLGRADRIPNYLKLANKINITTLKEINKINKFNTFFNKNYIIEQSEFVKKQDLYSKSILGTVNNLSKVLEKKLESIKINTSISDMHKATLFDIHGFNVRSWAAKKYGQGILWVLDKGIDTITGGMRKGEKRREDDEGGADIKEKTKNAFSDIFNSFKERFSESIEDLKDNLKPNKLKGHLRGADGNTVDHLEEAIDQRDVIIENIIEIKNLLKKRLGSSITSITPGSLTESEEVSTEGMDGIDERFEKISKVANKIFNKTQEVFSSQKVVNLKESTTDMVSNIFDGIKNLSKKEALDKLKEEFDKNKDKLKDIDKEDFLKFSRDNLSKIKNINKKTLTEIINKYADSQTLKDIKWDMKQFIDENLYESKYGEGGYFSIHPEDIKSKKERNKIRNKLNKTLDKAKEITPEFITKMFDNIDTSNLTDEEIEELNKLKEQSTNKFQEKFQVVSGYIKEIDLNEVKYNVGKILLANKDKIQMMTKEDVEKFLKDQLTKIKQLDRKQISQLVEDLTNDLHKNITIQKIQESLEHNFDKLKTSKVGNFLINRIKDTDKESLENIDPSLAKLLKDKSGFKNWLGRRKDNIIEGKDKITNLKIFKPEQTLYELKDVFEQNGVDLDEIISRLSAKEITKLISKIGYKGIKEKDIVTYRKDQGIKFKSKGNTKAYKENLRKGLMDLEEENLAISALKTGRDSFLDFAVDLPANFITNVGKEISKLPWTTDYDDPVKVEKRKNSLGREDIKEKIKTGIKDFGEWGKEKGIDIGHYVQRKTTFKDIKKRDKKEKPINKNEELNTIGEKLLNEIQEELGDENLNDDIIKKYITTKHLNQIQRYPERRDTVKKDIINKVIRKNVNMSILGYNTGAVGRYGRAGADLTVGSAWRTGRDINRWRKSKRNERQHKRIERLRSDIIKLVRREISEENMSDDEINKLLKQRELASVTSIGVGGYTWNTISSRRNKYINKILGKILEKRRNLDDPENENMQEIYDKLKIKGFLGEKVKGKAVRRYVESTEEEKNKAEKLRKEIIKLIQDVQPDIETDFINKHINNDELLKVTITKGNVWATVINRKRRFVERIIRKVSNEYVKIKNDEDFGATALGGLRKKSKASKIEGGGVRNWELALRVKQQGKLKNKLINEGKSEEEINIIMNQDRNEILDSIKDGINKLGSFFKPKKSLTDRDGDGDDDESYFDQDKKEEVEVDDDGNPIEKEEESRSLLSKLGKFMGPISSIFSGVASTLGGLGAMLGGVMSGALSLVSGLGTALATLAGALGLKKLGLGLIGAKLASLMAKFKGGGLGRAGTWTAAALGGVGKAGKWALGNKFKTLAAIGLGNAYLNAGDVQASETPNGMNFDFSNIGLDQNKQQINDELNTTFGDTDVFSKEPDIQEKDQTNSISTGDVINTGINAHMAKGMNPFKSPAAVRSAIGSVKNASISGGVEAAKKLGLKGAAGLAGKMALKGAVRFIPILGWAFLAYDVYKYGDTLINYFLEKKQKLKDHIYLPISVFYREDGPEQNDEGKPIYTDSFISEMRMVYNCKFGIMLSATKSISVKDIDQFKSRLKSLSSYSLTRDILKRTINPYKKALMENSNVKSDDVDKYVKREIDKLKMKNKLFLKYLSETTNDLYIQRLHEMALYKSEYSFKELLMLLFADEDFLNYIQANEKILKEIGPIFNKKEIKELREGKLDLNKKENKIPFPKDYLDPTDISSDINEPGETKPNSAYSFLRDKLGAGTLNRIGEFINNIWGGKKIPTMSLPGQTQGSNINTFDPRIGSGNFGGTGASLSSGNQSSSKLNWGDTTSLPEDIDNRSGWKGLPTNSKGQVLTDYEIPGIKRSDNHVSLQHLTENTKACLIRLQRFFGEIIQCNSAFRTPIYNENIGSPSGSQHPLGTAVDLSVRGMNNKTKAFFLECAFRAGFSSVGFYANFLHFDIRNYGNWWCDKDWPKSIPSWAKEVMSRLHRVGMSPKIETQVAEIEEPNDDNNSSNQTTNELSTSRGNPRKNLTGQQTPITPANYQSNIIGQQATIHQASYSPSQDTPYKAPSTEGNTDSENALIYLEHYRNSIKTMLPNLSIQELEKASQKLMELANLNHDQSFLNEVSKELSLVQKQMDKIKNKSGNSNLIKASFTDSETNTVKPMKRSEFLESNISELSDEQLQVQHDYLKDIFKKRREESIASDDITVKRRFTDRIQPKIYEDMDKIIAEQDSRIKNNSATNQIKTSLKGFKNPTNLNKLSLENLKGMISNIKGLASYTTDQTLLNEISETLIPFEKEMKRRHQQNNTTTNQNKTSLKRSKNPTDLNVNNLSTTNKLSATYISGMNNGELENNKNMYKEKLNKIEEQYKSGWLDETSYKNKKKILETNIYNIEEEEFVRNDEKNSTYKLPTIDAFGGKGRSITEKISPPTMEAFGGSGKPVTKKEKDEYNKKAINDAVTEAMYYRPKNFKDQYSLEGKGYHASDELLKQHNDAKSKYFKTDTQGEKDIIDNWSDEVFWTWDPRNKSKENQMWANHENELDRIGNKIYNARENIMRPDKHDPRRIVRDNEDYEKERKKILTHGNREQRIKDDMYSQNRLYEMKRWVDFDNGKLLLDEENPDKYDPRLPKLPFSVSDVKLRDKQFPDMSFRDINEETGSLRERERNIRDKLSKDENNASLGHELFNTAEQRRNLAYERHLRGNFDDVRLRHRDVHGVASEKDLSETSKLTRKLKLQTSQKNAKNIIQSGRDNIDRIINEIKGNEDYKVQPRDLPKIKNIDELDPRNKGPRDGVFSVKYDPDKHDPRKDNLPKLGNSNIDPDTGKETYPFTTDEETTSSPSIMKNNNNSTGTDLVPVSPTNLVPVEEHTVSDPLAINKGNDDVSFEEMCNSLSNINKSIENLTNLLINDGVKVSNFNELKENENKESIMPVEIKESKILDNIHSELKSYNETSKKFMERNNSSNVKRVNPDLGNSINTKQKPPNTLFSSNV